MAQDDGHGAPAGAVCDPVSGVCKMPPRAGGAMIPGLSVSLEDESGTSVDPQQIFKGKMVGIYFSAGWCPPCKAFSPVLSKWAKKHSDDVVIVFCSFDKSEPQMKEYINGKGFLRIPFSPDSGRMKAAESYGVQSLPTLVIVNGDTGATVTTWGRSAVSKNPSGCLKEWKDGKDGVSWLQLMKPW